MTVELATMYDGKLASVTLETGEAIIANSFSPGALTCYLVSLRCDEPSGASVRTREWVGEDEPTEEDLFYFIAETVRHSSYDEYLGTRQRMCIAAAICGQAT